MNVFRWWIAAMVVGVFVGVVTIFYALAQTTGLFS